MQRMVLPGLFMFALLTVVVFAGCGRSESIPVTLPTAASSPAYVDGNVNAIRSSLAVWTPTDVQLSIPSIALLSRTMARFTTLRSKDSVGCRLESKFVAECCLRNEV